MNHMEKPRLPEKKEIFAFLIDIEVPDEFTSAEETVIITRKVSAANEKQALERMVILLNSEEMFKDKSEDEVVKIKDSMKVTGKMSEAEYEEWKEENKKRANGYISEECSQ